VTIYTDPDSMLTVILKPDRNFLSGWKLSPQLLFHVLRDGEYMNKIYGQLEGYVTIVKHFIGGEITAIQFEESYLDAFKNQKHDLPENAFKILNELFMDIDAFCSDPELREEDDIDDRELLHKAKLALKRLS